MNRSYLHELIDRQVATSLVTSMSRMTDRISETLADELLRDPTVRANLLQLIRAAFEKAVKELEADRDPISK